MNDPAPRNDEGGESRVTDTPSDLALWRHAVINRLNLITGYSSLLEIGPLNDQQRKSVVEITTAAREIDRLLARLRASEAGAVVVIPTNEQVDDGH